MWTILISGCSDYGFKTNNDGATTSETSGSVTGNPSDTGLLGCEPLSTQPEEKLGINEDCVAVPTTGTFDPVVEWSADLGVGTGVIMMPVVVQTSDDNGDGVINDADVPDIVAIDYTRSGTIFVLSGDNGRLLYEAEDACGAVSNVAAGDIYGDGLVEFIAPSYSGGELLAFEHDLTPKWTSDSLGNHMTNWGDAVSIADMDGDGTPEITVGRAILDNNGGLIAAGTLGVAEGDFGGASVPIDVDGDGQMELVVGNAMYNLDGSTKVAFENTTDGFPAVANFDDDPEGEIVVAGLGSVRLIEPDGTMVWEQFPGGASWISGVGPPTIADFDGDGEPEVGVASVSRYTVYDTDGTQLWSNDTQDSSSGVTGSSVFDFEGDGIYEVVYGDETRLWVFSGPDGAVKLESDAHANGTIIEYPVIVDIDGDGQAEIVVPNHGTGNTSIMVIGDKNNSWMPARRIWNQHAYNITVLVQREPDSRLNAFENRTPT